MGKDPARSGLTSLNRRYPRLDQETSLVAQQNYGQAEILHMQDFRPNQVNPIMVDVVYYGLTRTGQRIHAGHIDDNLIRQGYSSAVIMADCMRDLMIEDPSAEMPVGTGKELCSRCFAPSQRVAYKKIRDYYKSSESFPERIKALLGKRISRDRLNDELMAIITEGESWLQELLAFVPRAPQK